MNFLANRPIRIGVLSDTHLPDSAEAQSWLFNLVESTLFPLDMLLHAGDLVGPDLLTVFSGYPVHVVRGNMDSGAPGVPLKKIINIGNFTIGIIHGWGSPEGLENRILNEFPSVRLDCLVYGHSHRPVCHYRDNILFFNPGSVTDRRNMAYHSVGLLELTTEIRAKIIRID